MVRLHCLISYRYCSQEFHNNTNLLLCDAELFRRVLAAPILFFLRTPVGDVLNAFARDQVSGMVTSSCCSWVS